MLEEEAQSSNGWPVKSPSAWDCSIGYKSSRGGTHELRDLGNSSEKELACSQDQVVLCLHKGSKGVVGSQHSCGGGACGLWKPCQVQLRELGLVGEADPFLFRGLGEAEV